MTGESFPVRGDVVGSISVPARERIVREAAQVAGISYHALCGPSRLKGTVRRRWHVMAILRRRGWSVSLIGQAVGRDHSTVVHGLNRWQARAAIAVAVARALMELL